MPKISVILPVYNAEKYLRSTLESLLLQTFEDFEVIAVNDGSKDGSLAILTEYAAKDKRIKIIDKANGGVSAARNTAIEAADGDYLAFIDADDIYSPEYLARMYSAASETGADVTVCDYVTFRGEKPTFPEVEISEPRATTVRELLDTGLMTSLWVKLIKKDIITKNGITFDSNMTFGEDLFFCWKACLSSENTVKIAEKLYGYRLSGEGATMRYHEGLYEKYKAAFEDLKGFAKSKGVGSAENLFEMDVYFTKRLPSFAFMCARSGESLKAKKKYISRVVNDAVISDTLTNHFDRITDCEPKRIVRLYKNAKDGKVGRVFAYGLRMELRLRLSSLKNKIKRT